MIEIKSYIDGNVHIVPNEDVIEHFENINCPCQPKVLTRNLDTGCETISHNCLKDMAQ